MNANTVLPPSLFPKATLNQRAREKEIYLELWYALEALLEISADKLTTGQTLEMERIARLVQEYEDKLYPMPRS